MAEKSAFKFDGAELYASNFSRFTVLHAIDLVQCNLDAVRAATTILDVGCGTGAFGLAYLDVFPQGIEGQTIIFSDLSENMIKVAERILTEKTPSNFKTKFVFQIEDGTKLDGIKDSSIDVVASVFGVFLIPDRQATFNAIHRVLQPSGLVAFTSWTSVAEEESLKQQGFGVNLRDVTHNLMVRLTDHDPDKAAWARWILPDEIKVMLVDEAGMEDTIISRSMHSVVFPSAAHFWDVTAQKSMKMRESVTANDVENARKMVVDMVAGGSETAPFLLHTLSNLISARKKN